MNGWGGKRTNWLQIDQFNVRTRGTYMEHINLSRYRGLRVANKKHKDSDT